MIRPNLPRATGTKPELKVRLGRLRINYRGKHTKLTSKPKG